MVAAKSKQDLLSGGATEASNHLYIGWKGPRLGDVVKALETPEARGGGRTSRRTHAEPLCTHRPSPRAEAGGERRNAYKPSGRDRKLLRRLEECALETRGELLLETLATLQPELYGGSCPAFSLRTHHF